MTLGLAVGPARAEGRYQFGSSGDGTFVVDSSTGRVWRYDRTDDAWYLYDLEALVKQPAAKVGRPPAGSESHGGGGSETPPVTGEREPGIEDRGIPGPAGTP